jgi:hypothetical protein
MTKIFAIFFSLFSLLVVGQTNSKDKNLQVMQAANHNSFTVGDSADYYISQLGCNSAIVTTTYLEQLVLNPIGQRLVELRDKNLNDKLLAHLGDTSKALAIHIILTKRLEVNKSGFGLEYVYDKDYKHILRVNYSCNNFHWHYLVIDNNPDCFFHIDKEEINKAKQYWTEKLKSAG